MSVPHQPGTLLKSSAASSVPLKRRSPRPPFLQQRCPPLPPLLKGAPHCLGARCIVRSGHGRRSKLAVSRTFPAAMRGAGALSATKRRKRKIQGLYSRSAPTLRAGYAAAFAL